jgi:selenocysteine lyase/cysteine desulfurase
VIYLDNAATSFPKAPGVALAMHRFLDHDAANPGRAGHRMAVAAEHLLDQLRLKLTRLFEGDDPNRLIFAMNCTDALNMAIKGVIPSRLPDGNKPHVITTVLEHNSVSRPLTAMEAAGQIELTRVNCDDAGRVDLDELRRAVSPRTVLAVVTHASNVLGTLQDAAAIGRICRERDILFCLDAAQTAGAFPVSIRAMCIDLLAFPGHKSLLGPTGTGGLYVGPRCPDPAESCAALAGQAATVRMASYVKMRPWREGGTGGDSTTPTQPAIYPYYLEGGTPNTVGAAGLLQAVDHLQARGLHTALAHEQHLVQRLIDRLTDDERFTVYGGRSARERVGTLSLNVRGFTPQDVGSILDDSFRIAVRPGLHCAPGAHRRIGSFPDGTVRVSPGPFNTEAELDALAEALLQIAG